MLSFMAWAAQRGPEEQVSRTSPQASSSQRPLFSVNSCLTGLTDTGPVGQQQVDQGVPLGILAREEAQLLLYHRTKGQTREEHTLGEKEFDPWSCSEDSSFLHHHVRAVSPSTGKRTSMSRDGRKGTWPCKERLEGGRAPLLTCLCWAAGGKQEEG